MFPLFPISQLFWFGACLCAWLLAAAAPGSVPCKDYLPPILRIENSLNGSTSTPCQSTAPLATCPFAFQCQPGFTPTASVATCTNGTWDLQSATCDGKNNMSTNTLPLKTFRYLNCLIFVTMCIYYPGIDSLFFVCVKEFSNWATNYPWPGDYNEQTFDLI